MVDVVNKRCQHVGCKKRPVFGFEGEKGRFCSLHRSGVSDEVIWVDVTRSDFSFSPCETFCMPIFLT